MDCSEFLPASAQVYMLDLFHRHLYTTNSLFGQQLKYCFLMMSVTTCDKCDLMCRIKPHVTM